MTTGTARLAQLPWRRIGFIAFLVVNLPLAVVGASIVLGGSQPSDWAIFVEAAHRFGSPDLYATAGDYAFRWHPLMALAFGPLSLLGVIGWRLLHILAGLAMPTWTLRLLVLVSWPFWWDIETGNVIVFLLLAAVWALRGSRLATVAFLLATVLIPLPLMLPVAAWLLWKRPEWRAPFAAMVLLAIATAFASGYGPDWIVRLVSSSGELTARWNLGPSRLIGSWWLLIGLPVAAWLTYRGRLGLASLAASPYWLPYYLLMLLLEVRPADRCGPHGPGRVHDTRDGPSMRSLPSLRKDRWIRMTGAMPSAYVRRCAGFTRRTTEKRCIRWSSTTL